MNKDAKKILARISKICRDNIEVFGYSYEPRWYRVPGPGPVMKGAKAEGYGVMVMAQEILTEIKLIRRELRKENNEQD